MLDVKQATRISGGIHARINERCPDQPRKKATADNVYSPPRYVRNKALHKEGYGGKYILRSAGEIVEINTGLDRAHRGYEKDRGTGSAGRITQFSQKSRVRLAKVCSAISWGSFPFLFVTLTYPDVPTDGRTCAAHLNHFRMKWERRYGPPIAVWKREFQRRESVHFHLAIARPPDHIPLVEIQRQVALMWYQVVGSGNPDHLVAGTSVEPLLKPPIAYFSSHGLHGRDKKGYQNEVPAGFENPGRFWGTWNIAPDWHDIELSPEEWVEARRILRAWARSKKMKVRRNGGRVQGAWFRTRHRSGFLMQMEVLRAVQIAVT